jgi:hypothetical protein
VIVLSGEVFVNAGSLVSGFVPAALTYSPWSEVETVPSSAINEGGKRTIAQVRVRSRPLRKSSFSRTVGVVTVMSVILSGVRHRSHQ